MLTAIKRQILLQKGDWLAIALISLGAGIFGCILFVVVSYFAGDAESIFPLGTILAAMTICMFHAVVTAFAQFEIYFDLEVSMGSTRKQFLVSWLAAMFVAGLLDVLVISAFHCVENALAAAIYPQLEQEINLIPYLLRYGPLAAAGLSITSSFFGVLVMRFGKKIGWIVWGIIMIVSIGLPEFDEIQKSDSLFAEIVKGVVRFLQMIPMNIWIIGAVAACIAMLLSAWMLLRRQAVTL